MVEGAGVGGGEEGTEGSGSGMALVASSMGVSAPGSVGCTCTAAGTVGTWTAFVLLLRDDLRVGTGLNVTIRDGFSAMHAAQNLESRKGKIKTKR